LGAGSGNAGALFNFSENEYSHYVHRGACKDTEQQQSNKFLVVDGLARCLPLPFSDGGLIRRDKRIATFHRLGKSAWDFVSGHRYERIAESPNLAMFLL
jgi:hypothetical protein